MFERYTESARRVIFHARTEASWSGSRYIEPAHLLLGILREDKQLAGALIGDEHRQEQFKSGIGGRREATAQGIPTAHDLPLSRECRHALACAAEEADRLQQRSIGPVHLLIGLLQLDEAPTNVLAAYGVTMDAARQHALQHVPQSQHRPVSPGRVALHTLVERLPENRLGAAHRLLQALSEERVEVSGNDSQGSFSFEYGTLGNESSE